MRDEHGKIVDEDNGKSKRLKTQQLVTCETVTPSQFSSMAHNPCNCIVSFYDPNDDIRALENERRRDDEREPQCTVLRECRRNRKR